MSNQLRLGDLNEESRTPRRQGNYLKLWECQSDFLEWHGLVFFVLFLYNLPGLVISSLLMWYPYSNWEEFRMSVALAVIILSAIAVSITWIYGMVMFTVSFISSLLNMRLPADYSIDQIYFALEESYSAMVRNCLILPFFLPFFLRFLL